MEMAPNEAINHERGPVCVMRDRAVIYSRDIRCDWLRKFGFRGCSRSWAPESSWGVRAKVRLCGAAILKLCSPRQPLWFRNKPDSRTGLHLFERTSPTLSGEIGIDLSEAVVVIYRWETQEKRTPRDLRCKNNTCTSCCGRSARRQSNNAAISRVNLVMGI